MKRAFLMILLWVFVSQWLAGCDTSSSADEDDDDDNDADDDNDNNDNDNDDNDTGADDDTSPTDDDDDDDDDDDNDDDDNNDNDDDNDDNDDDNDDDDNDDSTPHEPAAWTFVVYMAADNSLDYYADLDLDEMMGAGSTDDVNLIVIFDGDTTGDSRYYQVWPGSLETLVTPGELNMGSLENLKNTVGWAFTQFPAEKYALIFWNHGSGWHADGRPRVTRDVCWDDGAFGDALTNTEVDDGLAWLRANTPASWINLIGFDACLMQMTEIAYYIQKHADVMVASEETEGGPGWDYEPPLVSLAANPTMDAAGLGTAIAQAYVAIPDSTQSAVDLAQMNNLAVAASALADELIAVGGSSNNQVLEALWDTLSFADWDYIDLYDFAASIIEQDINDDIDTAAAALQTAVENAVIWHGHGESWYEDEHGISIYFPDPTGWSWFDPAYYDLEFAEDTTWDDLIAF